jgi:hypothetical protein
MDEGDEGIVARLGPIEKATDPDKQATTPAEWIIYRGVKVTSRYRLAHEMKLMRDVIDHTSARAPGVVTEIFCDSKATSCFSAEVNDDASVERVAALISEALLRCNRGHNDIYVSGPTHLASVDPDWDL